MITVNGGSVLGPWPSFPCRQGEESALLHPHGWAWGEHPEPNRAYRGSGAGDKLDTSWAALVGQRGSWPGQPVPPVVWDVTKGLWSFWGKQKRLALGIVRLKRRWGQQSSYAVVLLLTWLRTRMSLQALAGEAEKIKEFSASSCLLHCSATLISAAPMCRTVSGEGWGLRHATESTWGYRCSSWRGCSSYCHRPATSSSLQVFVRPQPRLITGRKRKCGRWAMLALPFLWMLSGSPGYHLTPAPSAEMPPFCWETPTYWPPCVLGSLRGFSFTESFPSYFWPLTKWYEIVLLGNRIRCYSSV